MSAAGAGAGRRITVRSVSCRGVKSFVPFQKPPLYAAVSLGGRREKTLADADGGENPDWDGVVFAFDLDAAGAGDDLLRFEVKAQVPLLGNKIVGTACVPVADLGGGDGSAPRHVSYQVCASDGKPNGTLSFAYAITRGGAYLQPQLYPAPNGARPEQGPSSCCAPPPPPSSAAYPAPAMPNVAPHSSSYPPPPSPSPPVSAALYPQLQDLLPPSSYPPPPPPPPPSPSPPVSAALYPQLQDLLPPSSYPPPPPPPPMMNSQYPAPNFPPNSSYPPPAALATAYPPPPASCTACSAPPAQYISSYPPPPPSNYPPPPPSGYATPAPTNPEFPASNFPPPTSSYLPPPPESSSEYPILPRSTPSPAPSSVYRASPYMAPPLQDAAITYLTLAGPPPSGGSYYPLPGTRHPEEAASTPYCYPPPGTRYS